MAHARLVHARDHGHAVGPERALVAQDPPEPLALRAVLRAALPDRAQDRLGAPARVRLEAALHGHGERAVLAAVERGLDATGVNPGTLTGPFDFEPSLLGAALLDLRAGRVPVLIDAITDYCDARDVADAMIAAAESGSRGERYLLTGDVLDMRAMLAVLREATGMKTPKVVLPLWVGWAALPVTELVGRIRGETPLFTAGTLRAAVSNPVVRHDKARRELGYAPRPMAEAMRAALAFFDRGDVGAA
mgnify:CR=1 FL=1